MSKKLIAMIPARVGSKRIPKKNLRYLNGKPLIMHAIDLAQESDCFSSVWVNSEDDILGKIALDSGANFHKRPEFLAADNATNREFTQEFLENHDCDYVIMVNTTSPTLKVESIKKFCDFVFENDYDTVLSTISEQAETFYEGQPLNFELSKKVNSQDLHETQKVIWALTAWKRETFLKLQSEGKNPIFGGKTATFAIPKDESCDLDTEEDWKIAEGILKSREFEFMKRYYTVSEHEFEADIIYTNINKEDTALANQADIGVTPDSYSSYMNYVKDCMDNMVVTDSDGRKINNNRAMREWVKATLGIKDNNSTIFFVGNGASASISEHMSADMFKNGEVNTQTCSETTYLTAISNDISYDEVFAFKIERSFKKGDMLVATSSSGNSKNVIRAIEEAQKMGGFVVTLSGLKSCNKIRKMGDLNFYIPAYTYGTVEVAHSGIQHCWLDNYLMELNNEKKERVSS